MDGDRVKLGRALTRATGPLVATDHNGNLAAVCPTGPAYGAGVLIGGPAGGNKTGLVRYMTTDLVRTYANQPGSLELIAADGKGAHSFLYLTGQPGVVAVATTPDPASGEPDPLPVLVREYHAEVQRRYATFAKAKEAALVGRQRVDYRPPSLLVFCLDEYGDWNLSLTPKLRGEMVKLLTRCGQIGREVNCRMWLAMQAPYAKLAEVFLPGLLKQQLGVKIAATGLVGMSDTLGGMLFDDRDAGNRIERYGDHAGLTGAGRKGLGLVVLGRREVPFKTPYMADPLHWETSAEEAAAAWRLLPHHPSEVELRRLPERRREAA
jgi:hypothetical protein